MVAFAAHAHINAVNIRLNFAECFEWHRFNRRIVPP
jgi:hypothetical protein